MTDRDRRIKEAAEAEHIVRSELFRRVWADLKETYLREAVQAGSPDEKLAKLSCIAVLFDVQGAFVAKAMDGRIAESEPAKADNVV